MHDDKREILFSAIDHYNVLTKNQKKILIEFYDCIIKANDLVDFQILIDDNKKRATTMINFEKNIGQNLEKGL